eukprot:s3551_g6.t1
MFPLAYLSFLVVNSSLHLCISSTCRWISILQTLLISFFPNSARLLDAVCTVPFSWRQNGQKLCRYAILSDFSLYFACHVSPAGDQDATDFRLISDVQ